MLNNSGDNPHLSPASSLVFIASKICPALRFMHILIFVIG
jgi:hypothetical protein